MPPTSANEQTFAEAAKVCLVSAEQGDAKSQFVLALMYQQGKGLPQDYAEALRWYRKAADQGSAKAQYGLSYMYRKGQGVQQDYAEANRWCRKAADQNNAKAQSALGSAYYYGEGVQQDYAEAMRWYRKAADQGEGTAQDGLGTMYYYGRGVPQDYAEAARWYRKSADQGYAEAQYNIGCMYYYGRGVPQDRVEAALWYRKAADQGDEFAQRALGLRGVRLSTFSKIALSIGFFGSLILAMSFLLPGRSLRNRQQILMGLLGLSYVGLNLYRHSPNVVLRSVVAVNALSFTQRFLGGLFVAMAIVFLWPKIAKTVLGISGTLLVGINLLLLALAHHDRWRLAGIRGCYPASGLLIGISVPLAVFLWLQSRKPAEVIPPEDSQR